MNWISLKFQSAFSEAQLEETEFFSSLVARKMRCRRGQLTTAGNSEGTFPWTGGVMGMCAVLLKAKLLALQLPRHEIHSHGVEISSEIAPRTKALDSALAKSPRWILDMFGVDSTGAAIIKRLFKRRNPEGKRAGPISVSLNLAFIDPRNIRILLDGEEVRDTALLERLLTEIGFATEIPPVCAGSRQLGSENIQGHGVLLPFLDHYVLGLSGYGNSPRRDRLIAQECRVAMRLALLCCDQVFVPAVSYIQSPVCRQILDEHRSHAELGAVRLVSDAPTWHEFLDVRCGEYASSSLEHTLYSTAARKSWLHDFPIYATGMNTTTALHLEWSREAHEAHFQDLILCGTSLHFDSSDRRRQALACAAEGLGPRAFLANNLAASFQYHQIKVSEELLTPVVCNLFFSHFQSHARVDTLGGLAFVREVPSIGSQRCLNFGAMIRRIRAELPEVFHEMISVSSEALWGLKGTLKEVWG